MTQRQAMISTGHLVQRPGAEPALDDPRSRGGRATALVVVALAILMMVAL